MSLFTRSSRRPNVQAAAPAPDTRELAYCTAWGLTWTEWQGLTEAARRDCRDRVVYGPNFQAGTK